MTVQPEPKKRPQPTIQHNHADYGKNDNRQWKVPDEKGTIGYGNTGIAEIINSKGRSAEQKRCAIKKAEKFHKIPEAGNPETDGQHGKGQQYFKWKPGKDGKAGKDQKDGIDCANACRTP